MDAVRLETILSRYEGETYELIPVLQDIQDDYSYLPSASMCRSRKSTA
jgi:NADH:ubiquinone oxidoreductase subunit E